MATFILLYLYQTSVLVQAGSGLYCTPPKSDYFWKDTQKAIQFSTSSHNRVKRNSQKNRNNKREVVKSWAGMNEVNDCLFTSPLKWCVWTPGELGLLGERLTGVSASISNEIAGPFLGSLDKVPFSHTRKGEETTTAALTSLKFPFPQRQESQWAMLSWPAEQKHVFVFMPASVCSW